MAHIHYEEEQRFSNATWIWVATAVVILVAPVVVILDKGTSRQDTMIVLISTALGFIPFIAIMLYTKLQIRIDDEGVRYRFFPIIWNWKLITPDMIESYEVSEKRNLVEKMEFGYGKRWATSTVTMNITGAKFARFKLKNGSKLRIGTENPESLERALKKLFTHDNH